MALKTRYQPEFSRPKSTRQHPLDKRG